MASVRADPSPRRVGARWRRAGLADPRQGAGVAALGPRPRWVGVAGSGARSCRGAVGGLVGSRVSRVGAAGSSRVRLARVAAVVLRPAMATSLDALWWRGQRVVRAPSLGLRQRCRGLRLAGLPSPGRLVGRPSPGLRLVGVPSLGLWLVGRPSPGLWSVGVTSLGLRQRCRGVWLVGVTSLGLQQRCRGLRLVEVPSLGGRRWGRGPGPACSPGLARVTAVRAPRRGPGASNRGSAARMGAGPRSRRSCKPSRRPPRMRS